MFRALAHSSDEGLTLETLVLKTLRNLCIYVPTRLLTLNYPLNPLCPSLSYPKFADKFLTQVHLCIHFLLKVRKKRIIG